MATTRLLSEKDVVTWFIGLLVFSVMPGFSHSSREKIKPGDGSHRAAGSLRYPQDLQPLGPGRYASSGSRGERIG
jgi:hypothetical protein